MSTLLLTEENIVSNIFLYMEPKFLWLGFGVLISLFLLISAILLYHWLHYEYDPKKAKIASTVYFIGSFAFLASAVFFLTLYTFSL